MKAVHTKGHNEKGHATRVRLNFCRYFDSVNNI